MNPTELATKQIDYSTGLLRTLADQERLIAEQAATLATVTAALRDLLSGINQRSVTNNLMMGMHQQHAVLNACAALAQVPQ